MCASTSLYPIRPFSHQFIVEETGAKDENVISKK